MASRRGVSLIEVVIISLILGAVAVPLMRGFGTFTRGMHRTTRQTAAVYVAQSILEQIRHRVYLQSATGLDFADLEEQGARVATEEEGERSRYFVRFENLEGTDLHGITPESDPELYRQLSRFDCQVEVMGSSPEGYLDSDGNGADEQDMAEVAVTVGWQMPGASTRRSTTLWTIVTGQQAGSFE